MIRTVLISLLTAGVFSTAQAAVLITADNAGETSEQYFDKGAFVLVQGGQPAFGVDRTGNCWFVADGQLVIDPCEQMFGAMSSMRDQAMAGMDPQQRAMMDQMMAMRKPAQPPAVTSTGSRTIAGYSAQCSAIGDSREVCISEKLLQEVKAEMGDGRFIEMFKRFGDSMDKMTGEDPEAKAVAALFERGFPVLDMQKVSAIPGIDPAMLQFLPEAQRAQIMQQLGSASGQQTRGNLVTRVEHDKAVPDFDLSRLPRIGFRDFMQQSLSQMSQTPRTR